MSYQEIPLTRGKVSLVDEADIPRVTQYSWCAAYRFGNWYAQRTVRSKGGGNTSQMLHALLTGWPRTDHISGDGLDNRRANLRQATSAQNAQNMRSKGGASQFKGVTWYARTQRWKARITVDKRRLSLGYFVDERSAALAYDAAARKHFGEFAALNFPNPGKRGALPTLPTFRAAVAELSKPLAVAA